MNGRQAETDLTRMEKLYNDKLVSNEEYEKTLLAARQAREEIQAAKDNLEIVKRRYHQKQCFVQQHSYPFYHRRSDTGRTYQGGKLGYLRVHIQ